MPRFFKYILTGLALTVVAFATEAQTYHLPGAHQEEHSQLIAKQQIVGNQIKVEDTQQFLDQLFKEEEEPEIDIFTEGWDSKLVNPFNEADVPETAEIDVSRFVMPHPGYITSPYGYRKRFRRMHKGIDLKVYIGDTIRAAFDGKVRLTNYERRGYGYYVILRHSNGLETVYGHLSKFLVEQDQVVKAGDPIALGGNTGRSTGSHLHFETRFMGYAINPAGIFDFNNQTVHTDTYTFDKGSYQLARNYDPAVNSEYMKEYLKTHPQPKVSAQHSGEASYYTVKSGDSLSRIASKNRTTVKALCQLNNIKTTSVLRPGQTLRLR
ncbi:MAG: peptidoglycan DD-metalloendopeptidase family protein [Muribaculaceae bacterium]|nr:peptidoglycan DD-metalloendopeptidase family protein [Muribaculaceae bacterium]